MPETIQAYIQAVEDQIRWRRARGVVSMELRRHLEDQRDAFAAEGREDPERLAVEEMGDPVAVGAELDRLHRPRPQWGLLGLTVVLACAGAALRVELTRGGGLYAVSQATALLTLAMGTAALVGMYFLDISFLSRHPRAIYLGALAAGAASLWLSPEVNCASYYTRYVVLVYPVVYALWLYSCRGSGWRRFALAVTGGIPLACIAVLAPFLSGLFVLLVCGLILLLCAVRMGWFGPGRWRFALAALALAAGIPALYGQSFVIRLRLTLHPELDPLGAGYEGCLVQRTLQAAPLVRSGPGVPRQDRGFLLLGLDQNLLPSQMVLEWGRLALLLVIAAVAALLAWLLVRCLRQKQQLGRLAALAVVLSLGLETLFSAALNLGFVFFSAHLPLVVGNLHTVLDMALIGLALSVFRGGSVLRDEPPEEKRRFVLPWRIEISVISTRES